MLNEKKNILKIVVAVLVMMLFLAACAQGQTEIEPPEIRYGEDICIQCNMIISDPRFASAYVHEISPGRYESIPFDDIGELFLYADANPNHQIVAWYVHDYATQEWLDATQAHFVFSDEMISPMAQGTASHADLADAEKMAEELNGEVLDWDGVVTRHRAGELMVHAQMPDTEMAESTAQGKLTITNVRANLTIPADTGSLWMEIHNGTDTDEALVGAEVDGCAVIELHDMVIENDVMIMRPVEGGQIPVPAGEMVELKPGGLHVMCIGKTGEFKLGETIEITLQFANAGAIDVPAEVVAPGGMRMEHDHEAMAGDAMPIHMKETVLGMADVEGFQLELVSHAPLHSGYNVVMVHLNDAAGEPVSDAEIMFKPMMAMKEGMNHAAGVEQPGQEMPGMYHGAVAFPMPSGPDLGNWTLTVSFADPATGASGETAFDVEVMPSRLSGSFLAPDGSKLFLMAVQPIAPGVGAQPFEVYAMQKASATDWPPVDDLDMEITPWMPTMDHGSTNNENPVSIGNGHYLGQVNFSMSGPWTVTVAAERGGNFPGEVVFEFDVQ
ncbi:MAG: copper chaperone PCu(A)C [Chloroflexota bacterium]|nr:copper chaperone PCu(A)C [Chloroflexota bacterium]